MEVDTQKLGKAGSMAARMQQRIENLEAENACLRREIKRLQRILMIETDGVMCVGLSEVANGEVIDVD